VAAQVPGQNGQQQTGGQQGVPGGLSMGQYGNVPTGQQYGQQYGSGIVSPYGGQPGSGMSYILYIINIYVYILYIHVFYNLLFDINSIFINSLNHFILFFKECWAKCRPADNTVNME
jgi:hypothetical protein